jgi:tryptophanyl-tRNA synthetase
MHQFKEKSKKNENFTAGLFTYPVLMASDILLYDSKYVPVGIDQKQHVELARDIAIRFNNKFGNTFVIPEPIISKSGTKIMDLQDPSKKMSKSSENEKGVIKLLDDVDLVRKKIMSATTDSEMSIKFDPENKPGISNLINIYVSLTNKKISDVEKEFEGCNYGTFKTKVADVVVEKISEIQKKYYEYLNGNELDKILEDGKNKTREIAKKKYELVKEKIGFYN